MELFLKGTKDSFSVPNLQKEKHVRISFLAFACPTVFDTAGAPESQIFKEYIRNILAIYS
jgi:hypothetical protein